MDLKSIDIDREIETSGRVMAHIDGFNTTYTLSKWPSPIRKPQQCAACLYTVVRSKIALAVVYG